MTTWFIADPHFGHLKAAQLRGFWSVEEHDAEIMSRIKEQITGERDEVWWLGDIAFDGWQYRIARIKEIPGRHRLILGNQDAATVRRWHRNVWLSLVWPVRVILWLPRARDRIAASWQIAWSDDPKTEEK